MFPVEAIPWPFSPPMPTAKSILFITPEPVLAVRSVNLLCRTLISKRRIVESLVLREAAVKLSCMKKINPFLWFDSEAEQAAKLYVGIFKNSKTGGETRYNEDGPPPKGRLMTVGFTLDRVEFVALNGGPQFKFTEAISFSVNCETQDEIDYFWDKLSADGGSTGQCGWLKDKFGLSWQINPVFLGVIFAAPHAGKANHAKKQMREMEKVDIAVLEKAAKG